jgi:hypothetical protein
MIFTDLLNILFAQIIGLFFDMLRTILGLGAPTSGA